jgi:hypothetical protein
MDMIYTSKITPLYNYIPAQIQVLIYFIERCSVKDCDLLATDPGSWSDWVYTKKTSTGSWAVADHQKLCHNHTTIRIKCATTDDKEVETTGEHFECDKDLGFFCRNIELDGTTCSNYKFRLRCSATDKIGKALILYNTDFRTGLSYCMWDNLVY